MRYANAISYVTSLYFVTHLPFNAPDGGQRMAKVQNGEEVLPE